MNLAFQSPLWYWTLGMCRGGGSCPRILLKCSGAPLTGGDGGGAMCLLCTLTNLQRLWNQTCV